MYFDRPTLFANEDWCSSDMPRRSMTWSEFRERVRARVKDTDEYPDIVRTAFRNVVDHSPDSEYELAIDTIAREIQSRQAHVSEIERRRRVPGVRRTPPTIQMERRANGE